MKTFVAFTPVIIFIDTILTLVVKAEVVSKQPLMIPHSC